MIATIIADLFMIGLILGILITGIFIYLNSRDAKEQNRSLFDQYRRARKYAEAIQYRRERQLAKKVKQLKIKPKQTETEPVLDHSEIMAPHKATARR